MSDRFSPLEKLVVTDFSQWLPGRLCTSILSSLGAKVTWVLPPAGDPMRPLNPGLCDRLDAGKSVMTLNLQRANEAAPPLGQLFRDSDVVVEGYRPSTAARLGLTIGAYREARRGGVLCSLPAYRADSALAGVPAHDLTLEGMAGLLDVDMPVKPRVAVVDAITAVLAVTAVTSALAGLGSSDESRHVELPLAEAAVYWSMLSELAASPSPRSGVPGNGIYRCSDGLAITLAVLDEAEWLRLANATAREGGDAVAVAVADGDLVTAQQLLERLLLSAPRHSWLERLRSSGVAIGPVVSLAEALSSDYFAVDTPTGDRAPTLRFPVTGRDD